jgi:hypothetical protein
MKLKPFKTSADGYSGIDTVIRNMMGKEGHTLFGDTYDDGTTTFPTLKPEGEKRSKQAGLARERLGPRVKLGYQMALQRDAMYAYASRGRLNLHAWQSDIMLSLDAGRQLEYAQLA